MKTKSPFGQRKTSSVKKWWRSLVADTRGNALVMVGAAMIPMVGAVGLGTDVAQWVLWKRELHSAADLGAIAGARALAEGRDVTDAVNRSLANNALRNYTVDAIQNAPLSGGFVGDNSAVRVQLTARQSLPFSSLFLSSPASITVSATARGSNEVPNCVIGLDSGATAAAISIAGSSRVDMNCGAASNSNLDATSSDYINTGALSAVGTVNNSGAVTADTRINEGVGALADPLSHLAMPSNVATLCAGAMSITVRRNNVASLGPGCYREITVQGFMDLAPGTYIINGGNIAMGSVGVLTGTGVTFIFTNADPSPTAAIGKFLGNGSSVVKITASTTGDYAGILMFQDRRATPGNATNFFVTGNSGTDNAGGTILSEFQGAIYTPSTYTQFSGNSSINTPCMQVIARRVEFIGNTEVINDCPPASGAAAFGGTGAVRLVE